MPILAQAHGTHASGTFNCVGGNQTNTTCVNNNGPTFQFILFGGGSLGSPSHNRRREFNKPSSRHKVPHQINTPAHHGSADPTFIIRDAVCLLNEILEQLVDPADSSPSPYELKLMLEQLRQILHLAEYAVKVYNDSPLGPSLTNAIIPEVDRCKEILLELLLKLSDTWISLICTRISGIWRHIFRKQWEGDELASLKTRLQKSRNSLGMFIMALNWYVPFIYHTSSHHAHRNDKRWLEGHGSRIQAPQGLPRINKDASTLPLSYTSAQGTSIGSLGANLTCAIDVLFFVEGNPDSNIPIYRELTYVNMLGIRSHH